MSEMQEMIIDSTTKIMVKYSTKDVVNDAEAGKWAGELWDTLVNNGMTAVAIPEELGGAGGDYSDALSILRLAGKYSAPIPLAETYIVNWLVTELGEPLSDDIVTISHITNQEPLYFHQDGDGWIISGKVKNVPWARFAQRLLVFGETNEGTILSLVKLKDAKIVPGKNMAGEARDEVIFNKVYVGDCKVILVDKGEQLKKLQYVGALTRSVMMSGALENILEITVNHSSERSQFGRPLHRFQAVQHHLALLAGETAAASVAANYAIDSYGKKPYAKEIAMAKIRVNEAVGKANPIAHQVLAAIGFTYEHTLHHSTRRLWSWRDEYGTETDWLQIVTEELMKLKENGLWSLITGIESNVKEVGIK
jgi:acyl-CoA dehydrogenase